jgi:hypothetical protein
LSHDDTREERPEGEEGHRPSRPEGGRGLSDGLARPHNVPPRSSNDDPSQVPERSRELRDGGDVDDPDLQQITALVLAQLNSEQHLHLPLATPDPEQLLRLKRETPEAYKAWLRIIEERARHDMWMERAPYALPAAIVKRGQILALVAVLAVLVVAGYALYLDHEWIATFLVAIDLAGLAAVFLAAGKGDHERDRRSGR